MRGVREEEAAEGDTAPEAGGDVPDAGGGGVPVGDQERDDPSRDGHFGALVGEDEESAEDGGSVAESLFEEAGFAVGGAAAGGGAREIGGGWVIELVGAEGEVGEGEVEDCEAKREEVDG